MFIVLLAMKSFSQNPEIKKELPEIIPPSPTVSAFMKFEEVPVSNYTGVPNISIPLFNTATRSKNINLAISLSYHTTGVAADEKASDVGLGWSLFAGGTVSRTVNDLPDEIFIPGTNYSKIRLGVYQNIDANLKNNYYYFIQNIANETLDYYKPLNQLTQQDKNIGNEFLWEAANTNKYDTEHDLWQYNFMGNSGRFYIKKNLTTNVLEVVPLEYSTVKIINHYSTINNNPYVPTGFTIHDEKGYKFVFDVIETTINKSATMSEIRILNSDGVPQSVFSNNIDADKSFNSSFHLSKIYDYNNNLIIDYVFKPQTYLESFTKFSEIKRDLPSDGSPADMAYHNQCQDFPPVSQMTNSTINVATKKLDYIDVIGVSKIYFEYLLGRQDTNLNSGNQSAYLNSITITDASTTSVKKINFEYDYSTTLFKRLILEKLKEFSNQANPQTTAFKYQINQSYGKVVGKDYWGYLNLTNPCESNLDIYKRVSPDYCGTDLLETITYPTGGFTKFNFEPNTYSYKGDQAVANFFEDEQNMDLITTDEIFITGSNSSQLLNTLNIDKIKFYPSINLYGYPNVENQNAWIEVKNETTNEWEPTGIALACFNADGGCCVDFYPEANKQYLIRYKNTTNPLPPNPGCSINYEIYRKNYTKQYLSGGGNRIKNIEYFEKTNTLIKSKNYKYNFFDNTNKSSGSLVFPKPIHSYNDNLSEDVNINICTSNVNTYSFDTKTSNNAFSPVRTNGGDIGYKNVTLFEDNLGKTEQVFYSPIDFPEEDIPSGLPFVSTSNIDYKRGLLEKEMIFNNSSIVSETTNSYEFVESIAYTGISFLSPKGQCYTGGMFTNYDNYIFKLNGAGSCFDCLVNHTFAYVMRRAFLCGLPLDLDTPKILLFPSKTAIGWSKLTSKTTKNYFYEGSTQKTVQTNETYTYNSINKMISEQTVTSSVVGELMKTKYFYLTTVDTPTSKNNISTIERIETYKNNDLLTTNKVNYSTNFAGNVSYLPQTISSSKGSNSLETRVRFNAYDEISNPLDVQQENGTRISYIYGYNKTLPVAKLENIAYANIPASLITNIQTVTNSPTSTEAQVLEALNGLYNSTDVNLQNAMITTFTYKPLVGVKTVTDPKGYVMTYHYDAFNRLEKVTDAAGNIVTENLYHYRTQN
jgi:YD repeat-containing protein